jgi:uncharacterized Ntn-hydrolase superfamily protein
LTQNLTDPRLGLRGLDLLMEGFSATEAIQGLIRENRYAPYRQLAAIDGQGRTACFSGEKTQSIYACAEGEQCVAIGNLLANPEIPREMVAAFVEHPDRHLAHRLLQAVEKGLQMGGEISPVNSAGLLVVHDQSWPIVDLRVDWHDTPVTILKEQWERYETQIDTFLIRALRPDKA